MNRILRSWSFQMIFMNLAEPGICMTPISFAKTTESHDVKLVTINRQNSYGCGILRQNYGIIRGMPMDCTRFADWVTILVVNLLERTDTGRPNYRIGLDCAGQA